MLTSTELPDNQGEKSFPSHPISLFALPLMQLEVPLFPATSVRCQVDWSLAPSYPTTSQHGVPGFPTLLQQGGLATEHTTDSTPSQQYYMRQWAHLLDHLLDELVGSSEVLRVGAFQQASQHLQERWGDMGTGQMGLILKHSQVEPWVSPRTVLKLLHSCGMKIGKISNKNHNPPSLSTK